MSKAQVTILVIDDDDHIRRSLRAILSVKQYNVQLAENGRQGIEMAIDLHPGLIILDLSMPGLHGLEVCRMLREWYTGPIIVLSGLEREADKVAALDLGADDYVMKPCAIGELLARIRAHLRRVEDTAASPPIITAGGLTIDIARRHVTLSEQEIALTPTEFSLLALLARNAECVVTYRMIVEEVWRQEYFGDTRTVSVHISNLRKKLESRPGSPQYIQNEHGVGFRFVTP